jgi:serine/threonine protein kinase/class 3 adenylate cyclase
MAAGATDDSSPPTPVSVPVLPSSFDSGRYNVKSFLGEGGRKRVYLAHDTKLDRDVAFSVIKTEGLDADGLARVKREAQAMGRLGDHPNIVTVFDTDQDGDEPYIVSQYMAGGDLAYALKQRPDQRYPIEVCVLVGQQVCAGLEHAHARGIVHRDLKPGNIWFDSSGVAKIGDFGLAVALDRSRLTMAGMMVGTAGYMPPEQAMGGETTSASDLYALGCVLYEMVAGRPPFVGDDTVAVISQHVNTAPVAPTWHNSECPPGLETLILRLLEKDPKQRPSSAAEVREALASVPRSSTPAPEPAATAAPQPDQANPIYRRTFVGREQELKQLENAFDSALSGQGSLVMIVGEPGIGKTTITEQLATYVGMRGGKSLTGHCYEEGSLSLPYLAFVEMMRSYVVDQDADQLKSQLGSGAAEVARIVSEVRDRVNVESGAASSPEEERFRLFQAVAGFLRNASGVQGLCLVLEDLHDADKGTMEMLVHLSRNLAGARILLVGTYRDVEVDRTHPLSGALAELRRNDKFQRIPLRGLSPDEVSRMLSHIAGQDIPFELAEAIYRQTEGNPLFVQELIRNAAEEGLIKREGGEWVATVDSLINYIPEGLRDVIGRRLSRLSEECNRILAIAAIIGRDFAVDVLRKVAGVSEDELLTALEEAINVSLIEEMRGQRELRYRFTHAFFRQTLYEEMIAPRRLRMHNEVAKALEEHYTGREEEHAAELAEHFSHSSTEEDLRKAVRYGTMAAQRASSVHAYGEAVRHLEQALQVQEVLDPKDGSARLVLLAELIATLGPAGEGDRILNEEAAPACGLAESLGETTTAAHIAEAAVYALIARDGTFTFATPTYREWCERIATNASPGSREQVMADGLLGWHHWALKNPAACWELRRRALDTARGVEDAEALTYAAFCFMSVGAPLRFLDDRLQLAEEMKGVSSASLAPYLRAQYLYTHGTLLHTVGDAEGRDAVFGELADLAGRIPDPYAQSWNMLARALIISLNGDFEGQVNLAREFAAASRGMGIEAWGQALANLVVTTSLRVLGRYDEMEATFPYWRTFPYGEALAAFFLADVGRLDEAHREMTRLLSEFRVGEEDSWVDEQSACGLLAVAATTGDAEAASLLYPLVQDQDNMHALSFGCVGRHLAVAAIVLGDITAARTHLDAALRLAERVDRCEFARSRFELARLLFDHYPNEKTVAAEHLDFATREFQAMKTKPLLDECLALKLRFQGLTSTDLYTSIDTVASKALAEQPDLRKQAAPDGTVTIMFSDIEGSTEKTAALGDTRWMEVLREHGGIIREQLKVHDGFEVKSEGDGFMLAFQSARKAIQCAIAMQRAFQVHNEGTETPVRTRMGLHTGEVIKEGDDFFGIHVNLAARVAGKADGGEILVSSLLKDLAASGGDIAFGDPRTVEFKGIEGEQQVWPVEWSSE